MLFKEDLPGIREEIENGGVPSSDALAPFMTEHFEAANQRLGHS